MKLFFTLLSLILISQENTFARSPAVEPVRGISIEHFKAIPPSEDQGFHFEKGKPTKLTKSNKNPAELLPP